MGRTQEDIVRRILTLIALLSAAVWPGYADDARLIKSVKLADLEQIITESGYTITSTGEEGEISVRATTTDGLIFNLIGMACNTDLVDGCLGISMQVRYDADGEETLERINTANLMWAATSAWYSQGGTDGNSPTVGISRYVILDEGVTFANIQTNLVNLLAIAPRAADYIWEVGEYAPDSAGDDEYWDEDW